MTFEWQECPDDGKTPRALLVCVERGFEMAFRWIPPTPDEGFRMGSRYEQPDWDWPQRTEQPVHRVVIPQGYWLGETPVTQEQFRVWTEAQKEKHENEFKGADKGKHPAENMKWTQTVKYCRWLQELASGQLPKDTELVCLPTEAEWEYASRAGTETEHFTGDGVAALEEIGRHDRDWYEGTRPVRQGAANAYGLHDLNGHVWQWCHDVWGEDRNKPRPVYRQAVDGEVDPVVRERRKELATLDNDALARLEEDEDGRRRVVRGGSWGIAPGGCRSACRDWILPGHRNWNLGFRVCLAPGPAEPPATKTDRAEAKPSADDGGGVKPTESGALGADGARGRVDLSRESFSAGGAGRPDLE